MEGGLLIMNAQMEDSGTYQCQVTNKNFYNFVHDDMPSSPQWRNSRPATLIVSNSEYLVHAWVEGVQRSIQTEIFGTLLSQISVMFNPFSARCSVLLQCLSECFQHA